MSNQHTPNRPPHGVSAADDAAAGAGASEPAPARPAAAGDDVLAEFAATLPFALDDFQAQACHALAGGGGVLVSAPTGAGKTVVAEFGVHLAMRSGRKAFYTTPIKALSNQKYADLKSRYGADRVGLLTGDVTINGEAPIVVMTTEVLRNMLYAMSTTVEGLGLVVMDEVHYLADAFRGPVWEEVIIHLPESVQVVALSATVSNARELGDWLQLVRGEMTVVTSTRRPVPLWDHVLAGGHLFDLFAGDDDAESHREGTEINPELRRAMYQAWPRGRSGPPGRRGGAPARSHVDRTRPRLLTRPAVVGLLDRDALLPAIYFIFSRAGCDDALQHCLATGLRLTTDAEQHEIEQLVGQWCRDIPRADADVLGLRTLRRAWGQGIAAHHAGMLPLFKEVVEKLFARGLIKVVFATETLALGINMPARTVVLDRLSKWNGTTHRELEPGEYTQLTGRAGRRGIDIEGHAVVVARPETDLDELAALASGAANPLRSAFRPTYNMAVNLVATIGADRARAVLETSFAQFQADRSVVDLARQAQAHAEAIEGYREAAHCDRGDFTQYARLRAQISARESALHRQDAEVRRSEVARALAALRPGDIVQVQHGKFAGPALVLSIEDGDPPKPTVLTSGRQVRQLSPSDIGAGLPVLTWMRLSRKANPRNPATRRDLASAMQSAIERAGVRPERRPAKRPRSANADAELVRLRAELRAHPCHECPDREAHARWAERAVRLERERDQLLAKIKGRTSSIARVFDRTCELLVDLGYLQQDQGTLSVTGWGQRLRTLYSENDLLVAECLRAGIWDPLTGPELAAVVSALCYESRASDRGDALPHQPDLPESVQVAVRATFAQAGSLRHRQREHRLDTVRGLDASAVGSMWRWARGAPLHEALSEHDMTAGDFVRLAKQVLDLLDQLSASPEPRMRARARSAFDAIHRGVVAYSGV